MTMATVNNGVNVQALLDAREALKGAPDAAKFTWRASCKWQNGTYSTAHLRRLLRPGPGTAAQDLDDVFEADHPEIFASEDRGITPIEYVLVGLASCLTAGVAAVAQNRGIQLRSVESKLEGKMDIRGILGHRQRRPERLRRHQGDVQDRRGRVEEGHRGHRRAVAEALGGVRRHHEPRERDCRSPLTPGRHSGEPSPSSDSPRSSSAPGTRAWRPAGSSRTGRSITCCSSAATSPTRGGTSAGTRCGCSRRAGRHACRAFTTTARTPTAT